MSRYIDADALLKKLPDDLPYKASVKRVLIQAPTAEVAREIFEEIERFLYIHFRFCKEELGGNDTEYVKGRLELNTQMQAFIAELKKKYTEEKKC